MNCMELKPHLPNLPQDAESTGSAHAIPFDVPTRCSPLDLIHRLLVYPPRDRLKAAEVLNHPWFLENQNTDEPLLLPADSVQKSSGTNMICADWYNRDLGFWLELVFSGARH